MWPETENSKRRNRFRPALARPVAMTGRYVEKATEPLRAAADAVSGRVAAAMNGRQEAEVVELKKSPA